MIGIMVQDAHPTNMARKAIQRWRLKAALCTQQMQWLYLN
jgi:hypothetical protein